MKEERDDGDGGSDDSGDIIWAHGPHSFPASSLS